jgi:hypothetical protein
MDSKLSIAIQNIKDAFIMHEEEQITPVQLVSIVESRSDYLIKEANRRLWSVNF